MKLWVHPASEPAPGFLPCTTPEAATTKLLGGRVEEVVLGGSLGLAVASWIERAAYRKEVGPVRWTVARGHYLDEINTAASMEAAELYWGVRKFEPEPMR